MQKASSIECQIKILCLGLRLAQIKCLLDEINNKLDILLQTPIQSAIRIFKTTLNTLKLGEMRNALEELKEAKSKAHDALSIFEMVIRLDYIIMIYFTYISSHPRVVLKRSMS